jgi:hypothetical protein
VGVKTLPATVVGLREAGQVDLDESAVGRDPATRECVTQSRKARQFCFDRKAAHPLLNDKLLE